MRQRLVDIKGPFVDLNDDQVQRVETALRAIGRGQAEISVHFYNREVEFLYPNGQHWITHDAALIRRIPPDLTPFGITQDILFSYLRRRINELLAQREYTGSGSGRYVLRLPSLNVYDEHDERLDEMEP